ncbi:MAG TPA: phosphoribosylformylglycinamidine synthase I [Cyanobacteria bacterium UBA8803]|nr:phosphoribosylformylglycinamidine synthase I [Cyanobacteria bacterium UBA9273]HBL57492.1 phosphoribosylformylglycinamidine synthase I [Cyanobacteria bacterium UBA8803]
MKFGIVVFPGSNCDRDVAYVTHNVLRAPTRMVWHEETDISDLDVVILPGGFSYGDYLRCGALAQFSPVMQRVVEHAQQGKFVLGICNGFQVLTEAGLLPGALIRNRDLHFICDRVPLQVERTDLPWTSAYSTGQVITLPIAHGEGRYYADPDTLKALEDNHQVLFRYCTATGAIDEFSNPNGSVNNIAGICDRTGRVLGMMPHPERASDPLLGGTDGLKLFQGLVGNLVGATMTTINLASRVAAGCSTQL